MKVAVIGAGNVGAMVASRIIDANLADCVLMDIVPGLAKGKALDISDARPIFNSKARIFGTEKFEDCKESDIVVITAGLARKPGMSRDDLLNKNAQIIKEISSYIKKYCPFSIVIVVTNPLDVMTYLVMKETGFEPRKVIGMAGVLDKARFLNILSERKSINRDSDHFSEEKWSLSLFMLGSHGDTMVPVNRIEGLSNDIFLETSLRTRGRGAEIVKHLKTGSAYFAPSAAVFNMLKAVLKNESSILCASAYLQGEYGEKDIYIGVPVKLDSSGVKEIVEIELTDEEKASFKKSAQVIREAIEKLEYVNR